MAKKKSAKKKSRKKSEPRPRKAIRKAKSASPKTAKRRRFVEGLVDGKSMRKAALDAGYTESMANDAGRKILPAVQKDFQDALAAKIPLDILLDRIAAGLSATEMKIAQKDGEFTDERELIAWEARRRYAELTAKLMGYMVEKVEIGGSETAPLVFDLNVNFIDPEPGSPAS